MGTHSAHTFDDVTAQVEHAAAATQAASSLWRASSSALRNEVLLTIAAELVRRSDVVLAANERDLAAGQEQGLTVGLLDRLRLNPSRVDQMAAGLGELASLPDPVGEVVEGRTLPNGVRIRCERVPLGVIGMIYEARPNVTIEAAGIALKCGNGILLRGGSAAQHSNEALVDVVHASLQRCGAPTDVVALVPSADRRSAEALMRANRWVDVLIPRGGKELIAAVKNSASVPVIETGSGNVHVYVDEHADPEKATAVVLNAKTQRPSVCNAVETLLVHQSWAASWLPGMVAELHRRGVVLHGDAASRQAAESVGVPMGEASEELYDTEFHGLEMTVAVMEDTAAALAHVARYSTGHTEVIVTESRGAAQQWMAGIDAAVVGINVSSRFTDGGQFGLGAEIGISTQKLHVRGPMGLRAMTSTRWIMEGEGQVRG